MWRIKMLVLEKNAQKGVIEELVNTYGRDRSSLLEILQAIQKKYNFISDYAQQEVARLLNIHPVEVYSKISFYSFLHSKPRGRNIVRLCRTISCNIKGQKNIEEAVKRELGIDFGETTKDRRITLEYTNCLGMCDVAPAMLVNERVYTHVDPETAINILKEIK
jgi:NADH:ubiquinone oxidoreductase subunit E